MITFHCFFVGKKKESKVLDLFWFGCRLGIFSFGEVRARTSLVGGGYSICGRVS